MQEGMVSVILPVYNVEKYINRCIESIINQTYKNLEIILIDDGSTDSCPQICDEWGKRDNRIKVVHKKNSGLGMARNTGINNALGEYICFFDSDDYIAVNAIEKLYKVLKEYNADVVCFGFGNVDKNGNIRKLVPNIQKKLYKYDDVINEFLPELIAPNPKTKSKPKFRMSAWSAIYSMEVIRKSGWKFVSEREIISEDVYSLLILYKNVSSVAILPEPLYFYCENDASLTRKYTADRYNKIKYFYQETVKLCQKLNYNQDILHRVTKPYLAFTITALKQEIKSGKDKLNIYISIKSIVDDTVLQEVLKNNKYDKVSFTRKILFWAIRNKLYHICIFLLKLKA